MPYAIPTVYGIYSILLYVILTAVPAVVNITILVSYTRWVNLN